MKITSGLWCGQRACRGGSCGPFVGPVSIYRVGTMLRKRRSKTVSWRYLVYSIFPSSSVMTPRSLGIVLQIWQFTLSSSPASSPALSPWSPFASHSMSWNGRGGRGYPAPPNHLWSGPMGEPSPALAQCRRHHRGLLAEALRRSMPRPSVLSSYLTSTSWRTLTRTRISTALGSASSTS